MRSSKSRSRSKSNRNRQSGGGGGGGGGNVVNRVFDSSGPEGKVRGTPQQIIDKYNQLSRDAHLSDDRVAVENFQQHAEHYMRLLSEAQREQEARREEQERQNRERQADRDRERADRAERQERDSNAPTAKAPEPAPRNPGADPGAAPQPDVVDLGQSRGDGDSGLVETPEGAPKKPGRRTRTRKPAVKPQDAAATETRAETPAEVPAETLENNPAASDKSGTTEAAE